jgi:hypothetical protein
MGKILNKYEHLENSNVISEIKHDINIEWLIKKVLKEAKYELVNKPKETIKVNYFLQSQSIQVKKSFILFLIANIYI